MESIRQYIIGVVAAALLCGIVSCLVHEKTAVGASVKFISGLLMVLAVMKPWTNLSADLLTDWKDSISADGKEFASAGQKNAKDAYMASIKHQLETYIQDEARSLGADITAEVTLAEDDVPVPSRVVLFGDISPSGKQKMTSLITERLGISREEQIWT